MKTFIEVTEIVLGAILYGIALYTLTCLFW